MSDLALHQEAPAVDIHRLELLTSAASLSMFHLKTTDPLEAVVRPGYFDRALSHGVRQWDRIEVTAIGDPGAPEFARLAVVEVRDKNHAQRVIVARLDASPAL